MRRFKLKAIEDGIWELEISEGDSLLLNLSQVTKEEVKQFREELFWAYELQEDLKVTAKKEAKIMSHPLQGKKIELKLVGDALVCPQCGERRGDRLEIAGDDATYCATCGCVFASEENKEVTNGTSKTAD